MVVTFKIMRFGVRSGELLWKSQLWRDLTKTWHTRAKYGFPLIALLLEPLPSCFTRVNSISEKKKKQQKIEIFSSLVDSVVISL